MYYAGSIAAIVMTAIVDVALRCELARLNDTPDDMFTTQRSGVSRQNGYADKRTRI